MKDKVNYEWRLTWYGRKDTPQLKAAAVKCETFPLWRDSKCHLIGYAEYTKLVEIGAIAPPVSYWQIEPGQVGMISLTSYRQYQTTWDALNQCQSDFIDGWRECEEHIKAVKNEEGISCRFCEGKGYRIKRTMINLFEHMVLNTLTFNLLHQDKAPDSKAARIMAKDMIANNHKYAIACRKACESIKDF